MTWSYGYENTAYRRFVVDEVFFYHPNDEGGLAWNAPELVIKWPRIEGMYRGIASTEGYSVDGIPLTISEKDQKWLRLHDTATF